MSTGEVEATHRATRASAAQALPALLEGGRRRIMALLIVCGLATAALAGLSAWATNAAMNGRGAGWLGAVLASALGVGAVRAGERILAERLGQSYIHRIRVDLVATALHGASATSPGVLIARTTNDLTAVKNWVSLGIAPMITAVPLVLGVLVVLALIHPAAAFALAFVVCVLVAVLALSSDVLYERARTVRKHRGRLASATADTVGALEAIRAAGGERRETNHIDRLGAKVAQAAVHRSRVTGLLRGASAAAAALATAGVVVVGVSGALTPAQTTSALLVVGIVATPLLDLGRVVEYRQNFKAARRVLVPALAGVPLGNRSDGSAAPGVGDGSGVGNGSDGAGSVYGHPAVDERTLAVDLAFEEANADGFWTFSSYGLEFSGGRRVPDLVARPGNRVLIDADDPEDARTLVQAIAGIAETEAGTVRIADIAMDRAEGRDRRRVLGLARGTDLLPRGSIDRAVRYREPDSSPEEARPLIERLGLAESVDALPKKERTLLVRGGEPLTAPQRALVHVARAAFGSPDVLVLDRVTEALDPAGLEAVRALVRDYPGVVFTTDRALAEAQEQGGAGWRVWTV